LKAVASVRLLLRLLMPLKLLLATLGRFFSSLGLLEMQLLRQTFPGRLLLRKLLLQFLR
jgi:hypothetical protein